MDVIHYAWDTDLTRGLLCHLYAYSKFPFHWCYEALVRLRLLTDMSPSVTYVIDSMRYFSNANWVICPMKPLQRLCTVDVCESGCLYLDETMVKIRSFMTEKELDKRWFQQSKWSQIVTRTYHQTNSVQSSVLTKITEAWKFIFGYPRKGTILNFKFS